MHKSTVLIGLIVLLTGCVSPRQISLFVDGKATAPIGTREAFSIAAGDQLQITFSSINAEAIAPYNSTGSLYVVDTDGKVALPVIGEVPLQGLTIPQAQTLLQQKVTGQVREALVQIHILNASITILGEVNNPGRIGITQSITLLEAIGAVGGLTHNAKCKDVIVQRTETNQVHRYHINLLNDQLCSSPCYYLQKGDVVIVSPLHAVSTLTSR